MTGLCSHPRCPIDSASQSDQLDVLVSSGQRELTEWNSNCVAVHPVDGGERQPQAPIPPPRKNRRKNVSTVRHEQPSCTAEKANAKETIKVG